LFWEPTPTTHISISAGSLDRPTGLKVMEHIFLAQKGDYYELNFEKNGAQPSGCEAQSAPSFECVQVRTNGRSQAPSAREIEIFATGDFANSSSQFIETEPKAGGCSQPAASLPLREQKL
jgi:hypothetical protein